MIDGVTITGGEPTLDRDIEPFIGSIRELGLEIKLDTNGLRPDVVDKLTKKKLMDYIALDIKTSPEKYKELTQKDVDFSKIVETVKIF